MKMVCYYEYLASTVDTDGPMFRHQGHKFPAVYGLSP